MPSNQNQDLANTPWRILWKGWAANFFNAASKQPWMVFAFILSVLSYMKGCTAEDKADAAHGKAVVAEVKAASAASVAVEAKAEAENKDLEQASYEVLSNAIEDLKTEPAEPCVSPPPAAIPAKRPTAPPASATVSAAPAGPEPPAPPRASPPSWDILREQAR